MPWNFVHVIIKWGIDDEFRELHNIARSKDIETDSIDDKHWAVVQSINNKREETKTNSFFPQRGKPTQIEGGYHQLELFLFYLFIHYILHIIFSEDTFESFIDLPNSVESL